MSSQKCIYCGQSFDPTRGEGDHILPCSIFGEFKGDIRYRGACVNCNNSFSPYEQILAQATPLGGMRHVNPGRGRRGKQARQRGARGGKSPQYVLQSGDHGELVQLNSDSTKMTLVDRITIKDEDGSEHYVRLYPGMDSGKLRNDIQKSGSKSMRQVYCSYAWDNHEAYKEVLADVFGELRWEERPDTEVGEWRAMVRTEYRFSTDAFRAIAKIAFHYYLVHNRRRYSGHEPEFAAIRDFISNGGDYSPFFKQSRAVFDVPFGETSPGRGTSPSDWCHILAAYEVVGSIIVYMRFFAGPGSLGEMYQVSLGEIGNGIMDPYGAWGHVLICPGGRNDGQKGRVEPAIIRMPSL